jgi:hypothetical protein
MKTIFSLCLVLLAVSSVRAEVFRPQSVRGDRHAWVHASDNRRDSHRDRSAVHFGSGYARGYQDYYHRNRSYRHSGHFDRHLHGHLRFGFGTPYRYSAYPRHGYIPRYSHVPSFGYYSGYGYGYPYYDSYGYYGTRSAATSGLLLGALAGGVIGHNSGELGHSAWRGSAWGAGLGWLLGSVVDSNRRAVGYQTAPVVMQPAPYVQAQPAASPPPQQVTIINNYYHPSTPMSAVNGMFGR